MNYRLIPFLSLTAGALFLAPLAVWADVNPDFDDDAKPILQLQPGLLHYVLTRYEVKGVGTAKYPGDDDHAPKPPYIFRARPVGSTGPYNLRLLIQPGPVGHILNVVDATKVHLTAPPSVSQPVVNHPAPAPKQPAPVTQAPAPAPEPSAPAQAPAEPTSDTPSGPIMDSGSSNLQPPPDQPAQ